MGKFIIFIGLNTIIFLTVFSQRNGQYIYETIDNELPFTVTQFSTKHGLPQNQVLDILELENGNFVLATANGITQFDGQEFTDFIKNKSYKNHLYSELYYNKKHKKLFGEVFGGTLFELEPNFQLIPNSHFCTHQDSKIYSIDAKGNIRRGNVNSKILQKIAKTNIRYVNDIKYAFEKLFIGTNLGLFEFDLKTKKSKLLSQDVVLKLKIIENQNIHFLTNTSLEVFDLKINKQNCIFKSKNFTDLTCLDFVKVNQKEYYIGTNRGLFHVFDGKISLYNKNSKLPSEHIQSLFYSKKNNCLFVGTGQKGLFRLDFKSIKSIYKPSDFVLNSLSSIVKHENKILISGSTGCIYDISNLKYAKKHLQTRFLLASMASFEGKLIGGTWGAGIVVYQNGKETLHISEPSKILNKHVHAIFKDSKNQIWVGTSSGISIGKSLENLHPFKEIGADVICFYELKNKSICVGTSKGVFIYDTQNKLLKHLGEKDGFIGKEVRSFYEDKQGKLWIGSYNGGLYCYYNKTFSSINKKRNCKLPTDIFCIAEGENDMLYFTGNLGLFGVNKQDLDDFYFHKKEYLIPFQYGEESGIYNTEFNGGFQNNYLKNNSLYYFPSIEGAAIFKPFKHLKDKSKLFIKNILVNESYVPINNFNSFPAETNSITINFSKANYNINKLIFFQYRLEKNNSTVPWSNLRENNNINLKLLPPGKYKLKIRAIDSFNDKNPETITYNFTIEAKFYQTWTFYVFIGLILIIITGFIVRFRMKINQTKQQFNFEINNKITELKLEAIQSRMNPHFIFNTLNNIKYYLLSENKQKAEYLLDKFSLLMRNFLHYSDSSHITINNELEIIKLHVEIEQIRLNDSFTFEINVDEIDVQREIPTMLIQPFIENAIKHGISHSQKPCHLILKISQIGDLIKIIIEDNGIGLSNSKEINKTRKNHISKGIKLVEDKIQNLEEKYGMHVNYTITEVRENLEIVKLNGLIKNNKNGTLVIIKIYDKL